MGAVWSVCFFLSVEREVYVSFSCILMAVSPVTPMWPPIFVLVMMWAASSVAYFADWSMVGGRPNEPTCVDIPKNMSLCADIGYDKMRLPNLLDHDTLTEVQQQSGSWVPLLNVRCHPQTKLFLCSLFTPVCLENQIYPCRSLCMSVQQSCEERMRKYGYFWPEMLRCDKFPEDNDMCIKAPDHQNASSSSSLTTSSGSNLKGGECSACDPVDTYENILDNFCRADTVVRARIRRQRGQRVSLRKPKSFKTVDQPSKNTRQPKRLLLEDNSSCCRFVPGRQKYLIMGNRTNKKFISPTFVLPWKKKSKTLRQAVRVFQSLDCNDPNLFTSTADDGRILPKVIAAEKPASETGDRQQARKRKRKQRMGKDESPNFRRKIRKRKKERKSKRKEEQRNMKDMDQPQ